MEKKFMYVRIWNSTSVYTLLKAPRYRRLCCVACGSSLLVALFAAIVALSYFDRQHNNIIHEYVARHDDVAILSATYYRTSKSFDNNTVVLLLNAHQVLHLKHSELQAVSKNTSGSMSTSFRFLKFNPLLALRQRYRNETRPDSLRLSSKPFNLAGASAIYHRIALTSRINLERSICKDGKIGGKLRRIQC
ncbi:hypothetical protein ANCDUO_22437 [Ancylostoma duodenale]|uniref:Uncharacterized protein n=1 Tax=Ancylostoma duodenale TaxID=51022 RepID=A0A0C2BU92_9BILA|nr:hypothetical protein ANCDUO_22437 [Ancylostoma duodenale]